MPDLANNPSINAGRLLDPWMHLQGRVVDEVPAELRAMDSGPLCGSAATADKPNQELRLSRGSVWSTLGVASPIVAMATYLISIRVICQNWYVKAIC